MRISRRSSLNATLSNPTRPRPVCNRIDNRRSVLGLAILALVLTGSPSARAGQQGVGQTPSPFPLSNTIRERGSSVTGAYEGWYNKDGDTYLLVGYFNRNTKEELDIPIGSNNRIEPGGPDMGQP